MPELDRTFVNNNSKQKYQLIKMKVMKYDCQLGMQMLHILPFTAKI